MNNDNMAITYTNVPEGVQNLMATSYHANVESLHVETAL